MEDSSPKTVGLYRICISSIEIVKGSLFRTRVTCAGMRSWTPNSTKILKSSSPRFLDSCHRFLPIFGGWWWRRFIIFLGPGLNWEAIANQPCPPCVYKKFGSPSSQNREPSKSGFFQVFRPHCLQAHEEIVAPSHGYVMLVEAFLLQCVRNITQRYSLTWFISYFIKMNPTFTWNSINSACTGDLIFHTNLN